jgi:glyoxylase-like metal-dependent hydrolase (beta-lactamase superfamily II)
MLSGIGGNVGVLVTDEGVLVVDTMTFVRQGEAIIERIRGFTHQRVLAILNTHYHRDHTHGNPAFFPGTKVIATARTLAHLTERDADYWRAEPARRLLPNLTFDTEQQITLGGKTVRIVHPGRGHTDGDLVVLFVEDGVLHAGDLFSNGVYPNIDLEAGGTVREWVATLDRVLALDFDTVIPGHGPLSDRAGLARFRTFVASLWEQTHGVAARGGSLADARRDVDLGRFGLRPLWFAPHLNRRFVIARAYEEATGRTD